MTLHTQWAPEPSIFRFVVRGTKSRGAERPENLYFLGGGRGWAQTNFVELWWVSCPRLAEMAIEIWVMCRLTEKLFETSLVR